MAKRYTRLVWSAACAALVAAAAGIAAGQAPPPQRPVWASKVDAAFAEWDKPGSPGCALGVYQDGRIAYARGYGMADLEHDAPITPDSVFYVGSVSKQFTAMAVALGIRQGRLGMDDDVRKYVPELPDYGRPITIRHLVHHTSGLRDVNTLLQLAGRRDEDAFDNDAVLRIVSRQKALNFLPGDEHLYSNSGYAMLALAVERAAGMPFAEYADANIFRPLGMTVSHFHTDLSRIVKGRAFAYDVRPDSAYALNTPQNERAGAGGLFTTVRELAFWDENFYSGKVGGPDLIKTLETPGRLNTGTALSYAWGLTAGSYRGMPIVEHGGSLGGYRAHILRIRGAHASVAVLCNVSAANAATIVRRVVDAVLEERLTQPVPPEERQARPPAASAPAAYTPEELASCAGRYDSDELETSYVIMLDGSSLKLRRGAQRQVFTLRPGPRDEFRLPGSTIRFRRDRDGRVTGLIVDAERARGLSFEKR